jgi:Ti-type conjugative transfer relaxase TraA
VIARSVVGKGVSGLSRYVLGEGRGAGNDNLAPGEDTRVAWIGGQNFGFAIDSRARAELATRIMEFDALNQTSRTRRCEKDALHLTLAWRVGEAPDREEMEAAAASALKAIGMGNAKAISAAHRDEQHAHQHIVASKIDPDTGRTYNLKSDYLKLSKWAQQYEREHGGIVCLRREGANELRDAIDRRDPHAVLEALTRQRATFTAADLDRALGKQIGGELTRAQFGNLVLDHGEVVRLADEPGGPTTRYSTRTVLGSEDQVLQGAARLAQDGGHAVGDRVRGAVLESQRFASMRADQQLAFERATGAEGLSLIDGQAGTGKGYTMTAIRDAYETGGSSVVGLAQTNAVAQDMARDGFRHTGTVHSELFALKNGRRQWDGRTVVMVDEAAMIDTKLMAELTRHASATGAKLILVGDDRQLASIDRGGMFGALKDRYGAAGITEVTRQHKDEERRASSMMAEGNFADALAIYQEKGDIQWTRTQDQARAALVDRWAGDSTAAPEKSRFVFAYTNADVAQLNADLRAVRRQRGELGEDHELPTADGKQPFAAGDRLQFTGTNKKLGLYNGVAGTVTGMQGTRLTVQLDGRRAEIRNFDAAEFPNFRHGYAGTIYKGQGRTLDQTYLYHSEHWRSAASYVALTRHRDKAELFVATNTARDVTQLARQMARVDDRRAASQFYSPGLSSAGAGAVTQPPVAGADRVPPTRERDSAAPGGGMSADTARGDYVILRDALREARTRSRGAAARAGRSRS